MIDFDFDFLLEALSACFRCFSGYIMSTGLAD